MYMYTYIYIYIYTYNVIKNNSCVRKYYSLLFPNTITFTICGDL